MTVWNHSRKGRIEGVVVREDDEWMWVRLTGEHRPRYASEAMRGLRHFDGDVMTLRKSLMTVVDRG